MARRSEVITHGTEPESFYWLLLIIYLRRLRKLV
jgi:hypothetical protein